ncbi:MAG: FAD-dependent oxidoreductase [Planctomycetota bacterium]
MPTPTAEPGGPALSPVVEPIEAELSQAFDLVVIGGGIYGVAALLEAGRRGLKALLLEADDFGGGVSWSSHRIIHGGLRYLQSLDFARFRASVRERRWFMETFPHAIEPLQCLVPLSGRGTRRPSLFACASMMNNGLNSLFGGSTKRLGPAQLLPKRELGDAAPAVSLDDIRGVGSWYDGHMTSSERVLICMLRAACDLGGRALKGARVFGAEAGQPIRVRVQHHDGREVSIEARRVVNCAGPASGAVAAAFGGTYQPLFEPMRAFNVLLDVEPQLSAAIALDVASLDGRMLFVVPGQAGLAIGTWEEPADGDVSPTRESMERLLEASCEVLGRRDLTFDRVSAVWSGLLPRAAGGELSPSDRPVIVDHGKAGGIPGAFSVSGVKYTTAREVADRVVGLAFPASRVAGDLEPVSEPLLRPDWLTAPPDQAETEVLVRKMIRDEAASTVDDVCRRRTAWYTSPSRLRAVASAIGSAFGMNSEQAADAVEASIAAARAVRG